MSLIRDIIEAAARDKAAAPPIGSWRLWSHLNLGAAALLVALGYYDPWMLLLAPINLAAGLISWAIAKRRRELKP